MLSLPVFCRKSPLIARLRERLRAMRRSPRTEDAYVHYIADFFRWSGWRRPETLTTQDVTDYLSYLAIERDVAASTQNVAEAALRFMQKHCLSRRKFRETDNLLTQEEIAKVIQAIPAKYLPHLEDAASLRRLKKEARQPHPNSPVYALRIASRNGIGRSVTPNGFFHSKILHAIAGQMTWREAEKKFGEQAVKTACAGFVRQFPKVLLENLTS